MPMHEWKKVFADIYHAFHHGWISALSDRLNAALLPSSYYALPEQIAAGSGPGVTLHAQPSSTSSETGMITRAYIEPFAVGDALLELPLFLDVDEYVPVPLEQTYMTAFLAMPLRWRRVLEA